MERIVEEIAMRDGEVVGPVEMRKYSEWNSFAEMPHQQRPDEAQHEVEPNRRGESPCNVGTHAERPGPTVGARPPQQDRGGQEKACHQPPASLLQRRETDAIFWLRRLQRKPGQLSDEFYRAPVH